MKLINSMIFNHCILLRKSLYNTRQKCDGKQFKSFSEKDSLKYQEILQNIH